MKSYHIQITRRSRNSIEPSAGTSIWLLRLRATNLLPIQLLASATWIANLRFWMKLVLQMVMIMVVLWVIRTTCHQIRRAFKSLVKFKEPKEVLLVINFLIRINTRLKSFTWANEVRKEALPSNLRDKVSNNSSPPWTITPQQPRAANISHKTALWSSASKPTATAQEVNLRKRRSSWSQATTSWSSTWHGWWLP